MVGILSKHVGITMNTDAFDLILLGTLDPYELYQQCLETGPNKIAEKYIATDASRSYFYAVHILKGRFELGEKAIALNSYYSYMYARNVLKRRFMLGEPIIKGSPVQEGYEDYFNVKL